MIFTYCKHCHEIHSDRYGLGPRTICPVCNAVLTVVVVGSPPPEPVKPDDPQQRKPLARQPRLL
jgi:hypothetical protein